MHPTDPRWPMYDALQRLLCAVLNIDAHYDTAHAPIDRVAWEAWQRDEAADDVRARMVRLMRSGIDNVPYAK